MISHFTLFIGKNIFTKVKNISHFSVNAFSASSINDVSELLEIINECFLQFCYNNPVFIHCRQCNIS